MKVPLLQPEESRQIAALIDGLSTPGFGDALDAMLRHVAVFDLSGVFVFPYDARPLLLHDGYTRHVAPKAWAAYLGGAYLLDPFYVACNNHHLAGLWRMRDLAPDDFSTRSSAPRGRSIPAYRRRRARWSRRSGFWCRWRAASRPPIR
ncbi:hypothetical protein LP421_17860 [Rhizobium sp. RCAM05350]|nr:hypothetical protein LP421_17860 [Rhizobium sp. RCAM05350]